MFVIGAFAGAMANFAIGNKLGRRPMIFLGAIGTLIGAALQTGEFTVFVVLCSTSKTPLKTCVACGNDK